MFEKSVYLDYAATTPLDPHVGEAMQPYFNQDFGNPSSVHQLGQKAEAAVERSRATMAALLGCSPQEIVFTACGSESDNLAVRGAALAARRSQGANHILVSPVEHDAVLRTAEDLGQHFGFEVERLPVDTFGRVSPDDLREAIKDTTAIVSIIHANNEIGTINPIPELARECEGRDVLLHTDSVQAGAHLRLKVDKLGVDMLSLGAHKFYGPKGVGALYVRAGTQLAPLLTGGSQEGGLRAGTHNVPLIVGMAEAFRRAQEQSEDRAAHHRSLRDPLIEGVLEAVPGSQLTGHPQERSPNHASFVFEGVDGNELLAALDLAGFACSSGSACKTGDPEPSQVLTALGLDPGLALGSLRVTVGVDTTQEQIEAFLHELPRVVERLRTAEGAHV